ncbi:hypothetical protein [Paractinoplanes ferrugineus]|nr:hypothetical protein [Actinoplanes ferrugineus]
MTSTAELERLVRPSDLRARRGSHSRTPRRRPRGTFGAVLDALAAFFHQ